MQRPYPAFTVSAKAEASLKKGHPWVFDGEILNICGEAVDGEIVDVYSQKQKWLGSGFYNGNSKIKIRLISRNTNDRFDGNFWRRRIEYAVDYRARVMGDDLKCSRLIFGEADMFPGMTADLYGDILVCEVLCLGLSRIKNTLFKFICEALAKHGITLRTVYERSDSPLCAKEGITPFCGFAEGYPAVDGPAEITENGIKYLVDFASGQKTGYFLDQKLNRRCIASLAKGLNVLDCCTHTGAFALNAAFGGAKHVDAVDISDHALESARKNARLNGLDKHIDFIKADVFDMLTELAAKKQHPYDLIVLDPPAFTKSGKTVRAAFNGYKEINTLAMRILPRGGYLATCSCSHFMTADLFEKMLSEAASEADVRLRQIEIRRQAPDHPILWGVPETEYLKFYIFQVV